MLSFTRKEQIVILILVILLVGVIGFNVFFDKEEDIVFEDNLNQERIELEEDNPEEVIEENNIETISEDIVIHISGAVNQPGIFTLKNNSRVNDAIKIAGGLSDDADMNKINLAKKISDEEKIHIYKVGEEVDEQMLEESNNSTETGVSNDNSKININTADNSLLESLPGIGKVKANNIIEYRNTNKFTKIEDIMNVDGIGEKTFQNIKEKLSI